MKSLFRNFIISVIGCLTITLVVAHAADVTVQIQPETFSMDQGGQLSVNISGGNLDSNPSPAAPDDVSLRAYGTSQNIQIVNGRMSRIVTHNFAISANTPGEYTIPSFPVSVDGQTLHTEPATFTVVASSSALPPTSQGGGAAATDSGESFLKLEYPPRDRDHLYVGEMAPVRITAFFPAKSRVSLQSAPRPEGQGFTLHNLSEQPEQGQQIVDGKQYRTVTWYGGVSTAKAGEYPIRLALDATVMVPDNRQQRARPRSMFGSGSPFNDPFFDSFFDNAFSQMIPKEMTLTSDGDPLDVRSLPAEGRPENFTGAVGQFSLGSYKLPADAITGEPRQIRVTVEGRGNFDRAGVPSLLPADVWKAYSPKTEFAPGDTTSFSGRKTFEFSAVPQKGGEHDVQLAFSFFDPAKGSYETVSSPAISLTISGDDVAEQNAGLAAAASGAEADASDVTESRTELAPPRLSPDNKPPIIQALFYEMIFWLVVALSVAGIAAGAAARIVRRRLSDPARVTAREFVRAETSALSIAETAANSGDAEAFFPAARRTLQTRLAAAWDRPAESIILADLRYELPSNSPTLAVFKAADAAEYAPAESSADFEGGRWLSTLQAAMAEIANKLSPESKREPAAL